MIWYVYYFFPEHHALLDHLDYVLPLMFDYNHLSHYIIGWFQKNSVKQTKTQIQFSCGDRRVSSYLYTLLCNSFHCHYKNALGTPKNVGNCFDCGNGFSICMEKYLHTTNTSKNESYKIKITKPILCEHKSIQIMFWQFPLFNHALLLRRER